MNNKEIQIFWPENETLIDKNAVFYPVTDTELTEREREKARNELGESEEKIRDCLELLKKKLSEGENEQSLNPTNNDFLLRYLRARKFDCKKACQSMEQLDYYKKNRPEFFDEPADPKALFESKIVNLLPYSDEHGRYIFHMDVENWKLEDVTFDHGMQGTTCLFDLLTMNPRCQVNGIVGIFDFKGLNRNHIIDVLRKQRMLKMLSIIQNAYPWRIKKVFLLNTGKLATLLYSLASRFLSKKIRDRVRLLGSDLSELYEEVNPAVLPNVLGGKLEEDKRTIVHEFTFQNIAFLKHLRGLE